VECCTELIQLQLLALALSCVSFCAALHHTAAAPTSVQEAVKATQGICDRAVRAVLRVNLHLYATHLVQRFSRHLYHAAAAAAPGDVDGDGDGHGDGHGHGHGHGDGRRAADERIPSLPPQELPLSPQPEQQQQQQQVCRSIIPLMSSEPFMQLFI
jgi:hypothetical protein